jgi:pyruvate dehydrogenase E2 component (dihydrolipoyllysine-residue acetyltransferase)
VARIDVVMPQMGESIAEGTLSRWLKKPGDEVKRDEPLFEISTDKVDAEIPSPTAGVLAEVLVTEGQTVPVQTVVARIETEKGATVDVPATTGPAPAEAGAVSGAPTGTRVAATTAVSPPGAAPRAVPPSSATNLTPPATGAPDGGGAGGNGLEDRLRTKSSPLVRKIAAEHGIDLAALRGSGIAGRVTKRDILQYIESGVPAGAAGLAGRTPSMHAPGGAVPHGPLAEAWPGDVVEPMSRMRSLISEHMVASRRTSAHVTSFFEVDFTRVGRIRAAHRAEFERTTGGKLTFLPFVVRVVVDGLRAFPVLNASVRGNEIIYRKQYNIGVAVALDWGLIVPVIKNADNLSVTGLARALSDIAERARLKRLDPSEVQGGTFTITNPGVFGSLMGTPIINQPQVGILGLGAIEKRPKVIRGPEGEDAIAIRTCAYLSLSFDHRIVDGADADKFLAFVKRGIETFPEGAL